MKVNKDNNYWNDDLQALYDVVNLGLRVMLKRGKITSKTYDLWNEETQKASIGKLHN